MTCDTTIASGWTFHNAVCLETLTIYHNVYNIALTCEPLFLYCARCVQLFLKGAPMKRVAVFFCLISLFTIMIAYANELSSSDMALIEKAGIPLHSDLNFVLGSKDLGFRFATSEPVDKLRQWYQVKLSGWALLDKYGSWVLYNGEPGLSIGEVSTKPQVMILKNDNLPEWHSLEKTMTTEIVIMVME